jgi:hypothetical protein
MAAVTGTVNSVRLLDYVGGQTKDSGNDKIASCIIFVSFAGTYATSDDGTIATVNTSIANARRDGKTITLRDMAFHSAGLEGTTPIGILRRHARGLRHVGICRHKVRQGGTCRGAVFRLLRHLGLRLLHLQLLQLALLQHLFQAQHLLRLRHRIVRLADHLREAQRGLRIKLSVNRSVERHVRLRIAAAVATATGSAGSC